MHKRTLLSALALAPLAVLLPGCGFQLRGAAHYPFASLYLQAPDGSELGRIVLRQLAASSSELRLILNPEERTQAAVVLHLQGERHERVVLAKTVSGQVRELRLRLHVRFQLLGRDGNVWIGSTEISQQADMSYSETLTLAKEDEEASLMRSMRQDIAQQLLRRLALVQPPAAS